MDSKMNLILNSLRSSYFVYYRTTCTMKIVYSPICGYPQNSPTTNIVYTNTLGL